MVQKIPHTIKVRVLRGWLRGLSRDSIALENKIGYGSVSEIIKEFRNRILDIELLREVSTELRKNGFDLHQIGASIRLKKMLDKINLTEEQIENILEQISIHCFQEDTEIEQFFVQIDEATQIANNLEISIYDIPEIIERGKLEIAKQDERIFSRTKKISRLVLEYGITEEDLEEYRITRPLADKIKQLEWELNEKDRTLQIYKIKIQNLESSPMDKEKLRYV